MVSKWKELRLDEVTELIVDCPHSTPKWTDEGIVVLRSNNIKNGRLDVSSPSYTDQDGYEKRVKRAVPQAGDLVLTREAPMGEVCQIPEGLKCCLGQRMVLIRVKEEIIDSKYLLYTLQSPYLQYQISWNEGAGTTVSNIRIPNIKAFQIPTPPIAEQKAIAHILGSLDDKIEFNRQMNETVEAMAQALFKSWFVDFDPVIDNALLKGKAIPEPLKQRVELRQAQLDSGKAKTNSEINSLFPSEFEFTEELGWIPRAWRAGDLGEYVDVKRGGSPRPIQDYLAPEGLHWVKISDATASNSRFIVSTKQFIKPEGLKKTTLLKRGALILSNSATPGLPKFLDIDACIHDGWLHFPKKETLTDFYLYQLFLVIRKELLMQGNGSVFTNLKTDILKNHTTVIPSVDILDYFDALITPMHKKMHSIQLNSDSLAKLRDTLLPKLMSGELRIADAEKLVAEGI